MLEIGGGTGLNPTCYGPAIESAMARRQDRVNWLNRLVAGCDCNRPTLETIGSAGFTVTEVEHAELPKAPAFIRPAIAGRARVDSARSDHPV